MLCGIDNMPWNIPLFHFVIFKLISSWEREDKTMTKLDLFFPFKTALFGQKSTHSLLGAWPFLLVHIWFTPSEEARRLCKSIL
jgi:hypothetical protein